MRRGVGRIRSRCGPAPPSPAQSRNGVTWALGALVVVLVVAPAGVVGCLLAAPDDEPPAAALADLSSQQPAPERVTVTAAPAPFASPPEASTTVTPVGDRGNSTAEDPGLPIPMTRPACDGREIVELYSAVTPGDYAQEIASALE